MNAIQTCFFSDSGITKGLRIPLSCLPRPCIGQGQMLLILDELVWLCKFISRYFLAFFMAFFLLSLQHWIVTPIRFLQGPYYMEANLESPPSGSPQHMLSFLPKALSLDYNGQSRKTQINTELSPWEVLFRSVPCNMERDICPQNHFLSFPIETCRVFTSSHLIHHSDRGPWLDQSSKIFASNNVEKSNIFCKCFTFRKKWDVVLLSHENSELISQSISN